MHCTTIRQRQRRDLNIGERNLAAVTHGYSAGIGLVDGGSPQNPVGGGQHHAGNIEIIVNRRTVATQPARADRIIPCLRVLRGENNGELSVGIRGGRIGAHIVQHLHIDLHIQTCHRLIERIGHPSVNRNVAIGCIDIGIHVGSKGQIIGKITFNVECTHKGVATERHLGNIFVPYGLRIERKLHSAAGQTIPTCGWDKREGGGIRSCDLVGDGTIQSRTAYLEEDAARAVQCHFTEINRIAGVHRQGRLHTQREVTDSTHGSIASIVRFHEPSVRASVRQGRQRIRCAVDVGGHRLLGLRLSARPHKEIVSGGILHCIPGKAHGIAGHRVVVRRRHGRKITHAIGQHSQVEHDSAVTTYLS